MVYLCVECQTCVQRDSDFPERGHRLTFIIFNDILLDNDHSRLGLHGLTGKLSWQTKGIRTIDLSEDGGDLGKSISKYSKLPLSFFITSFSTDDNKLRLRLEDYLKPALTYLRGMMYENKRMKRTR